MPASPSTIAVPWVASSSKPCFSSFAASPPRVLYRLRARKATHDRVSSWWSCCPAALWQTLQRKVRPTPMTSPVERISGPNSGSTPGNLLNGSTHFFHRVVRRDNFFGYAPAQPAICQPSHAPPLCQRNAGGFGDERNGTRRTRVNFNQVDFCCFSPQTARSSGPRTCNSKASFCTCWRIHILNFPDLRCRLAENMRSHRSARPPARCAP